MPAATIQPQPVMRAGSGSRGSICMTPLAMKTAPRSKRQRHRRDDRVDEHGDAADQEDQADDELPDEAAPGAHAPRLDELDGADDDQRPADDERDGDAGDSGMAMAKMPPMMKTMPRAMNQPVCLRMLPAAPSAIVALVMVSPPRDSRPARREYRTFARRRHMALRPA